MARPLFNYAECLVGRTHSPFPSLSPPPHITRLVLHFAKSPNPVRHSSGGKSIIPLIRPGEISSRGVHYHAVTLTRENSRLLGWRAHDPRASIFHWSREVWSFSSESLLLIGARSPGKSGASNRTVRCVIYQQWNSRTILQVDTSDSSCSVFICQLEDNCRNSLLQIYAWP